MVPMGFLSQFGSAVWLAIAYIYIIYIREEFYYYYIDIVYNVYIVY